MKSIFDRKKFDMTVDEIMTKHVITVTPHTSVKVCAQLMIENKIGSVIVFNKENTLLGIITKENMIKHVIAESADPEKLKAFEIMTSPVITASPKMPIIKAMEKMFKEGIRHLLIMSPEKKLLGICTDTDLFKVVPELILLEQEYLKFVESEQDMQEEQDNEDFTGYCDECKEFSDRLRTVNGIYICPRCNTDLED